MEGRTPGLLFLEQILPLKSLLVCLSKSKIHLIPWIEEQSSTESFVTLSHFEFPQELEDRFGNWLNPLLQNEYVHFADVCFKNFADWVEYWMTFNKDNLYAEFAYERMVFQPRRCSPLFGDCVSGNSDVEPLIGNTSMDVNHAVLVVGYGVENGVPYWLIMNLWEDDWGYNGYFKMERNKNFVMPVSLERRRRHLESDRSDCSQCFGCMKAFLSL